MSKENYIDKIELILNTSGKYITNKEKDMILDYVNYFKNKNNVIEDKNIELVIELERLHSIIKEVREYIEKNTEEEKSWLNGIPDYRVFKGDTKELLEILGKEKV